MSLRQVLPVPRIAFVFLFLLAAAGSVCAQTSSSSSSSSSETPAPTATPARARAAGSDGASVTLESDETLFTLAAALNTCGYDAGLANSAAVRQEVRDDIAAELQASALARQAKDAVCGYIAQHELSDRGRGLAQYISLALYVTPPPELTPTAEQTAMPPDALQVINILPLLRSFAEAVSLHSIWVRRRPEYDAITDKAHDPVTKMILATNIYLKTPASSYDGRRLQILIEPLLAPDAPNARIYGDDYSIVTSPNAAGAIRLDQIRHMYLHFELEPLVYSRAQSMTRLIPLLKPVANAPLDFSYKSDVVALVAECLIKAIEARTMDVGFAPPAKPKDARDRQAEQHYTEELNAYERGAEAARRKTVAQDEREGWVLTEYFYGQMANFERSPESLSETMGQMVYGMDIERERKHEEQIAFLPVSSGEFVRRARPVPTGMELAEKKMLQGDFDGAELLADQALKNPAQDPSAAMYVKARVALLEGDPETSTVEFQQLLKTAKTPHITAWAHIYLGRLYDIKVPAERGHAVAEYRAALAVPGVQADASAAAQAGLKKAFEVPKIVHQEEEPLDPSGKAEKEAYRPEALSPSPK